jgi:hypothetical protein
MHDAAFAILRAGRLGDGASGASMAMRPALSRRARMKRRLRQGALVLVVAFAAAQLVRPQRANPPIDPARTIRAHVSPSSRLPAVLDRACSDCHSNATVWPWYTQVAPVSWLMARGVAEGRKSVNFSEWTGYSSSQQQTLLSASCDDASTGRMPGPWTLLHPEARLSPQDIETICAAARQAETRPPAPRGAVNGGTP